MVSENTLLGRTSLDHDFTWVYSDREQVIVFLGSINTSSFSTSPVRVYLMLTAHGVTYVRPRWFDEHYYGITRVNGHGDAGEGK